MKKFSRLRAGGAILALALVVMFTTWSPLATSAQAGTSSSTRVAIVEKGYGEVNAIRSYFFCSSAACKKSKSSAEAQSATAIRQLDAAAQTLTPSSSPGDEKTIVAKFDTDVHSLQNAYSDYATQTSATAIAQNTGILYYETANVYTDLYLLSTKIAKSEPKFATWSYGPEAVLYTMQVDTQALDAKSSSAALDVATNVDLIQDCSALIADADGPNQSFNQLLVKFATTQEKVSKAENALFEKKKTSVTDKELTADITSLEAQFSNIAAREKSLSK